jgi:hypothetical protein
MPALSSTRDGYLQSPLRETDSFLVLAFRSGFECGQSGAVLMASGRVTVVTSVTTLGKGVLDLWSDTRVFSRVYGVSPRGCCDILVMEVTEVVGVPHMAVLKPGSLSENTCEGVGICRDFLRSVCGVVYRPPVDRY